MRASSALLVRAGLRLLNAITLAHSSVPISLHGEHSVHAGRAIRRMRATSSGTARVHLVMSLSSAPRILRRDLVMRHHPLQFLKHFTDQAQPPHHVVEAQAASGEHVGLLKWHATATVPDKVRGEMLAHTVTDINVPAHERRAESP